VPRASPWRAKPRQHLLRGVENDDGGAPCPPGGRACRCDHRGVTNQDQNESRRSPTCRAHYVHDRCGIRSPDQAFLNNAYANIDDDILEKLDEQPQKKI